MNKEYWIVEGRVTCQDAADIYGCKVGDVEWCFSDGPAGQRGYSADGNMDELMTALEVLELMREELT